jgi:hypothetical protein
MTSNLTSAAVCGRVSFAATLAAVALVAAAAPRRRHGCPAGRIRRARWHRRGADQMARLIQGIVASTT